MQPLILQAALAVFDIDLCRAKISLGDVAQLRPECEGAVPARRRFALNIRYHRLEAFEAWKSAAVVA